MPESKWRLCYWSDTGIGMTANDLEHIFDRFYRSDHARCQTLADMDWAYLG